MPEQPKKVFSLLQLLQSVSSVITKTYTHPYWIKAEITKINEYKYSGHCYPELVEKQDGKVVAQMRAIIWASTYSEIRKKFESVTKESLKEGMMVVFLGRVDFNPMHGFSLNILDIDPAYTLGDMMREKNMAIERLKKEKIFEKNRGLPLPVLPRRIAVISVTTSKGFQDFSNVLSDYQNKYRPYIQLFPALLQGEKAVESLSAALNEIERKRHLFDLVLILRGGGSDIGLNCYDNYDLAATIANFPLPVITGIGHSTNETVVEMVAWRNMITPTETAYFLMERYSEFEKSIDTLLSRILKVGDNKVQKENILLDHQTQQLKNSIRHKHMLFLNKLLLQTIGLKSFISSNIKNRNVQIEDKIRHMEQGVHSILRNKKRQFLINENTLLQAPSLLIQNEENRLSVHETKLQVLDPKAALTKGYSITKFENKIITDIMSVDVRDTIHTELKNGKIISIIEKIILNG